jgi:hypothetical protein
MPPSNWQPIWSSNGKGPSLAAETDLLFFKRAILRGLSARGEILTAIQPRSPFRYSSDRGMGEWGEEQRHKNLSIPTWPDFNDYPDRCFGKKRKYYVRL